MHRIERSIVEFFRLHPHADVRTSQLVETVFSSDISRVRGAHMPDDPQGQKLAQREKSRLHRKLLYHLNKLVANNVLVVKAVHEHGEKSYALQDGNAELVVGSKHRTISIPRSFQAEHFAKHWVSKGLLHELNTESTKIEAYAVSAKTHAGIYHIRRALSHLYTHIADAFGIIHAEELLGRDPGVLEEGIAQLIADSKDYGIAITFHIDLHDRALTKKDAQLISLLAQHNPGRIYIVYAGTPNQLKAQESFLRECARIHEKYAMKFNVQNTMHAPQPCILGRAGTYALTLQQEQQLRTSEGVIVATESFAIDFGKAGTLPAHELRALVWDAAKTMLSRTALKRRRAHMALAGAAKLGPLHEQLTTPQLYLRVWNYNYHAPDELLLIELLREEVDRFTQLHRTIFASCGVPLDFHTNLSSAFVHYSIMTPRQYTKRSVSSREGLKKQELSRREALTRLYDCDRMRIFREGVLLAEDLVGEVHHIVSTFQFGLVTYDFKHLQQTLSLEQFT